jgi:hypothetical protein
VTIPIRLISYIIYIAPIVSPPQTPPHPSESNCKRFLSSVSYRYMKSIYHLPSPILQSWFLLLIFKLMFNVCPLWVYFTLVRSTPSITVPYPFTSHPPFFNSFQYTSLYPLPSHLMLCDITEALSFSFPFPLS